MKPRKNRFILTAASALLLAQAAFAQDQNGTWTNTLGGTLSWTTPGNWDSNAIANGSGFTANFVPLLDIAADTTVTLDGSRTIGNLIFGDTDTGTAAGWILDTGSGGPLTLAATTPTITVNTLGTGKNARINATLDGTAGLTKSGLGTLVLGAANTYTGGTTLNGGTLNYSNASALSSGTITYTSGTILQAGVATTLANPIEVTGSIIGTVGTAGFATTLSGPITGSGTLAKGGGGVLTLTGGLANTILGGFRVATNRLDVTDGLSLTNTGPVTVLSGGSLNYSKGFNPVGNDLTNNITISGPGVGTFGALNLWGNAIATGTITLADNATISHDFNNATISGAVNGVDRNLTLTTTAANQPGMVISGPVTLGTGSITVTGVANSGGFSIGLSNANSYSGGTTITAGTLNYSNAAALGSGAVSFTGNSTLQAGVATNLANAVSVAVDVTGTVDTNNNATTLSGAITGSGNLTKTGAGTLTISGGNSANTLSGAIVVNTGTLAAVDPTNPTPELRTQSFQNINGPVTVAAGATFDFSQNFTSQNLDNAITISGAGVGPKGALNLWRNATATGAITLAADATISHDFNNATISGSITGTDRNLTLSTLTTGTAQAGMVVSGPISLGTGGITVQGVANSGLFSIKLSGINSYTGETRVVSGTLMLSGDARINDAATVRIESTTPPVAAAVLHLDFEGTDTVGALYLPGDTASRPNGTYGSSTSSATFKSADFAGNGILQVVAPANNYASWASSQTPPITGGENGDDDNDGVSNLVEYALVNGGERGVLSGTTITFTKRGTPYGGDLTYIIETSETLSDPWSPVVTHGPDQLGSPISYDLAPTPGTPKKFARLKVVKTP